MIWKSLQPWTYANPVAFCLRQQLTASPMHKEIWIHNRMIDMVKSLLKMRGINHWAYYIKERQKCSQVLADPLYVNLSAPDNDSENIGGKQYAAVKCIATTLHELANHLGLGGGLRFIRKNSFRQISLSGKTNVIKLHFINTHVSNFEGEGDKIILNFR